jgi:hypothetical protein
MLLLVTSLLLTLLLLLLSLRIVAAVAIVTDVRFIPVVVAGSTELCRLCGKESPMPSSDAALKPAKIAKRALTNSFISTSARDSTIVNRLSKS